MKSTCNASAHLGDGSVAVFPRPGIASSGAISPRTLAGKDETRRVVLRSPAPGST